MAVTTQVKVHDGSSWNTVANTSRIRVRRRVGAGEASFRVEDASIAQRDQLRTGRECEVVITVDETRKVFGGFIDRPRIQVQSPGHFSIYPRVVDLSHGASWQRTLPLHAPPETKYTDNIKDYWGIHWYEVDRTSGGVVDHPLTHPEKYSPGYDNLASFTNEIVQRFLPDWVWWVGHNGTDDDGIQKKLFVQPRGYNDLTGSVTITESDIGPRFDIQPTVDPRNYITVVGDDNPQVDSNWPLYATAEDSNSQSAYGRRDMVTKESEVGDTEALNNIAVSILEQRKFDLWQGKFKIDNWTLEPGDKVSLYLPTIGVNDGDGGVPWILMEVEEQMNRGTAQRWGTFVEHKDAAFFRVT